MMRALVMKLKKIKENKIKENKIKENKRKNFECSSNTVNEVSTRSINLCPV
jgi:hypothetical protein